MTRKCWLLTLCLLIALFFTGCLSREQLGVESPDPVEPTWLADGFDFPVGDPDGKGWAVTGYGFLDWSSYSNSYHPGEDWNIPGAGNGDQGEPVYSVANGEVVFSGWNTALGNVVLIKHAISPTDFVWSQYAHLDQRYVEQRRAGVPPAAHRYGGPGPETTPSPPISISSCAKRISPANAWTRTNGAPWTAPKWLISG